MMSEREAQDAVLAFLKRNYDYVWLKAMLEKGGDMPKGKGGTLITGSSHALNGIEEAVWGNAVNCSMHSQDLYYDFACARKVLERSAGFKQCFIIFGYYIAFQDLSLSKGMRDYIISPVYYPVLKDAHNWDEPVARELWKGLDFIPYEYREECEKQAQRMVYGEGTYYSRLKRRNPFFDFQGRTWSELTEEEQDSFGRQRADGHNSVLKYTGSYDENREILKDYVHYLHTKEVKPVVVIPPFTEAYHRYVDEELRDAVTRLVEGVEKEAEFIDFNGRGLFEDEDFIDTDHLNENGAGKLSRFLAGNRY